MVQNYGSGDYWRVFTCFSIVFNYLSIRTQNTIHGGQNNIHSRLWFRIIDPDYGSRLWIRNYGSGIVDPDYGSGLWIQIMDPDYGSGLWIRIIDPDYGSILWIHIKDPYLCWYPSLTFSSSTKNMFAVSEAVVSEIRIWIYKVLKCPFTSEVKQI